MQNARCTAANDRAQDTQYIHTVLSGFKTANYYMALCYSLTSIPRSGGELAAGRGEKVIQLRAAAVVREPRLLLEVAAARLLHLLGGGELKRKRKKIVRQH